MTTPATPTTPKHVIKKQKTHAILEPPEVPVQHNAAAAPPSLKVNLTNSSNSNDTLYAWVTGLATAKNSAVFLLQADGKTEYYPANPTKASTPLAVDCAIPVGAQGKSTTITIPYLAGARIWFCFKDKLTFLLNPGKVGPGLVEPAVSNPADPNYHYNWGFCELTYNSSQVYANISYVDFVGPPIALTSTSTTGATQHVGGLPLNGLENVCNGLIAQNTKDKQGWDKLVIKASDGSFLRALSPSNGIVLNPTLFKDYWNDYITQVWNKYVSTPLVIDTQGSWGKVQGLTSNDRSSITFKGIGSITKPSALDIFGANSGPFAATNTPEILNIGARIDAGFNRSTLLLDANQPDKGTAYYTGTVTNHYARIVHAANVDGRGYAFPYDDVNPSGATDASGFVSDSSPSELKVSVGGSGAYKKRSVNVKRDLGFWGVDEKALLRERESAQETAPAQQQHPIRDLEKGGSMLPLTEEALSNPKSLRNILSFPLNYLRTKNPAAYARVIQGITTITSITLSTVITRICLVIFCFFVYLLGGLRNAGVPVAAVGGDAAQ